MYWELIWRESQRATQLSVVDMALESEVSTYGTTIEYNIRVLQYFIWADDPSFFLSTESNHREEKVR